MTNNAQNMGLPSFDELAIRPKESEKRLPYQSEKQRDSEDQTETVRLKLTSGAGGNEDLDEEVGDDQHPFAISVEITGAGLDGSWSTAEVSVIGGTYQTSGGTAFTVQQDFPTVALTQNVLSSAPLYGVYVVVPVEPAEKAEAGAVLCSDGQYAKAKTGGVVVLSNTVVPGFPERRFNATYGAHFAVFIGSWTVRRLEVSTGVFRNRVFINQIVTDNIDLGDPDDGPDGGLAPEGMQFYYADGATAFFSQTAIFDGYDPDTDTDWSFKVPVASSKINQAGTFAGDNGTQLFDNDAAVPTAQTYYRVPVIRGGRRLAFGGAYRENIVCNGSKGATVELLKIG